MKITALLTVASLATFASAHWKRVPQMPSNDTSSAGDLTSLPDGFNSSSRQIDQYTRCASNPTTAQRRLLDDFSTPQNDVISRVDRVIEVYVHIVSTAEKRSRYNNRMIQNQMDVMNGAFANTGFSFELVGFDITVHESWARAAAGSSAETEMKRSLQRGRYRDLNLYFLSDLGNGLLGFCYFPTTGPSAQMRNLDGCINLADSMPGGDASNYNMGMTAVHEVGHWFGLYHVFERQNCNDARGDAVGDTPRQLTPTHGCPAFKDSCPFNGGVDNINNFMDYSYDQCLFEFTPGQGRRMRMIFDRTRA